MVHYKDILKSSSVKSRDFANKLGLSYSSYRNLVARGTPKWIKAFEFGYELGIKHNNENQKNQKA